MGPPVTARAWMARVLVQVRPALAPWLVARVVVALAWVLAQTIASDLDPTDPTVGRLDDGLLGWDAKWYDAIARRGYDGGVGLRFFPLLALLVRPLALIDPSLVGAGLLILVNGLALVLGVAIHRLCLREGLSPAAAEGAAWFVALHPAAFVLVWGYSEALIGVLAVAAFWAVRSGRWGIATAAGLAAGLTRPTGVLLALPAVIEAVNHLRGRSTANPGEGRIRNRLAQIGPMAAAVVAPAAGCALYLGWVGWRFGDPLAPLRLQQRPNLRGSLANPLEVVFGALRQMASGDWSGNARHLPWLVLAFVLVVVAWRRLPRSYGAYAAASVLVAASTDRLGSFERYAFSAFPLVMALALVTTNYKNRQGALIIGGAAMMGYATLAFLGAYVP
ncbi:MAG: mannosyltransferase family protein [Acidimicrobiales bacterium]